MIFVFIAFVLAFASSYLTEEMREHGRNPNIKSLYTVRIEEAPHHILVIYGSMFCSGSLVNSRVVVTAASCFHRWGNERVFVKVGSDSVVGYGQLISVIKVKLHEFYRNLSQTDNDIALLILEFSVSFSSKVKKTVLSEPRKAIQVGAEINVSGWGSSNLPLKYINKLLRSVMTVMPRSQCRKQYGALIRPSNYCASYPAEARLGDNGGSAMNNSVMVGLVSFGANAKEPPLVAVLTNVSYFYKWIRKNSIRYLQMYCVKPENHDEYDIFSNEYHP